MASTQFHHLLLLWPRPCGEAFLYDTIAALVGSVMPTFAHDLRTPLDLLRKLGRDLRDFREDATRQWDYAYNFSITAWHLTDWLWWYDRAQHPDAKKHFGCSSLRSFQAKICDESSDIKVCNDLATGSKHFYVARQTKVVETVAVSAGPGFILGTDQLDVDRLDPSPVLKVRMVDGTSVKAAVVLNHTMKFWFNFFQKHRLLPEDAKMEDFI